MKKPFVLGDWKILYKPEKTGTYVNDHTIIKANDGVWHLFGISSFGGGPCNEKYFTHGKGNSLTEQMTEVGKSIDTGTLAWAPCVIEKDDNYYMFYGPSPTKLAVSFDMVEWYGHTVTLNNEPVMAAHRDHFVLKDGDKYLMYIVGVHNKLGAVSVFESTDLLTWDFKGYALTSGQDAPLKPGWGAMESPFVVKKDGYYYLFITYTDCSRDTYSNTLVFASTDPLNFGEYNGEKGGAIPVSKIKAHAPEVLKDGDDYYITTCGWLGQDLPYQGCVSIAKLDWKE